MILLFLKKYLKEIIALIIIGVLFYSFYSYSYQRGYDNRVQFYEKQRKEDFLVLNEKIDKLEGMSSNLGKQIKDNQVGLTEDLDKITANVKNIKSFVIKNGECVPSQEFLDSFNNIILRGNKK